MVLKNVSSIKKPVNDQFVFNKNTKDLEVQMIDYYRCLDTFDDDDEKSEENENEDDYEDDNGANLYSKEKQKELSYTKPLLIKAYGILDSGHSITLNIQGFQPFFYIKIPDHWDRKQCQTLVSELKKLVFYKYKEHLIKTQIVVRKPFTEFTGTDTFKFLKLIFKNKESYDQYAYKLSNPLRVHGLNDNKLYKYDLYESNIEPIIKFIHLTKINPTGWIKINKYKFNIVKERTTHTNFEVTVNWENIRPLEKFENAVINVAAFDIEADSSHGDFPIGIKNYQKLAQDLVTLYNAYGINTKRNKMHRLFQKSPKKVLQTILNLVFNDDYNNNGIHQIITVNQIKPHSDTIEQLSYVIYQLLQQCLSMEITNDEFYDQINDLLEYNLPLTDQSKEDNSHYGLLAREIMMQLFLLSKNNNKRFMEKPLNIINQMINLAFNDYFDGFNISCIYTKYNIKPKSIVVDSLIPNVLKILNDCAQFTNFKKLPEPSTFTTGDGMEYKKENMSQDAFVKLLTDLFDKYLPTVEGDKIIQIGTTFQLSGHSDCYLKHIICLNTCDQITNEEMIEDENGNIYLPAEDLAKDLIMYEKQFGQDLDLDEVAFKTLIKMKTKEVKSWDVEYRKLQCLKAAEYRRIKQSMTDHAIVVVECYDNERDVLLAWKELIIINDPDVIIGYNIFGFDFKFMYERAIELNCAEEFCQLGRIKNCIELLFEQPLNSAGMGDNLLTYIPANGRVIMDLYKIIQSGYKLDSYKLDNVCHKFLYKEKVDISPQEIFVLQKGDSNDRKKIARYCLVDCILCNRLVSKLEIVGNNISMSNVCKVPFPYLFLRGQGVKIFSLVSYFCSQEGFLIPVLPKADPLNNDSFEGAIVLTPFVGIYFDPIAVADFNSLYPSSMISENLSHDSFVIIGGKYDNLPGYEYVDIQYDIYKWTNLPGKKKKIKEKTGVQTCRYAQLPNGKKSVLPSILMNLLAARKEAKAKMENETNPFKAKMWDGLQLAYKITANSLYGQCGAKTSPINKTEISASTTAVGRRMIMFSKNHVELNYKNNIIELDINISGVWNKTTKQLDPTKYTGKIVHVKNSYCVYGDTDSIFIKFNMFTPEGEKITGMDAVFISMALCKKAAKEISMQLKKPQNLEVEKVIYPFILISKKRYHGHYYTIMDDHSFYANSMGIALKRRDSAAIVKHIYGGAINIIMESHDIEKSLEYVKKESKKMLKGEFPLNEFVISRALKSYYKKPNQIAHNVLANRQAQRDPGNKFKPNDRVPYLFIIHQTPSKDHLQGDIIETPDFIKQNKLNIDYKKYLTNQIMKPVSQIFNLVPGFENTEQFFENMISDYQNELLGVVRLENFIQKRESPSNITKLMDLIQESRSTKENLAKQIIIDDEDNFKINNKTMNDHFVEDHESDEIECFDSNYDNPNF